MRGTLARLVALMTIVLAAAAVSATPAAAATCADFDNQAAAQEAANTRDADSDGIYCESLPCPCSTARSGSPAPAPTPAPAPPARACLLTRRVVEIGISKTRYPRVLGHMETAIRASWPRVLRINRRGADARRDRAVKALPTRRGWDRDEWPMAFARTSWRAHVAHVPSTQNQGAGASIGGKLRRYCNGQRFKVVGY